MPRFVILEHDHPTLHWDFMLEAEGVLKTWRLPQAPLDCDQELVAVSLSDHRLAYVDYEGPVSGGRGVVRCWDRGIYRRIGGETTGWIVDLRGERLAGTMCLEPWEEGTWRFRFQPDKDQRAAKARPG